MLVEGLAALIPSNTAVAAVLGIPRSDGTTGVFPMIAPDEALMPYIVMQQVGRTTVLSYDGVNKLQQARWRFSCYGPSYRTAKILAENLKLTLDGYVGLLADGTPLESTEPGSEVDDLETAFKATLYATHVDYTFVFVDTQTAVPTPPPIPVPSRQPDVFYATPGQTKFVLSSAPTSALAFYWNGELLVSPGDYTLVGNVVTTVLPAGDDDDVYQAFYS